ncbi:hypothetical protein BH11PSE12_BH11PSE12_26340 [soil metagenome]
MVAITPDTTQLFDESERRQLAEACLRSITLSTSRVRGDEFFRVLVKDLALALDMHFVIAGEILEVNGEECNRTLAIWAGQDFMANMTYPLLHSPCSNVADQSMCFHACHVQQAYPLDPLLGDMGAESYIGMPMIGTEGTTLGILVALDVKPIDENRRLLALSLLSIFAARCAAELQHRRREAELESLVAKRTRALENARDLLVQREKLAALGSLVAGVAHAINTPMGNALTTVSSVRDFAQELQQQVLAEKVSKTQLLATIQRLAEGSKLAEDNLNRAAELISNFRMLADTRESDTKVRFNLRNFVTALAVTHNLELKKHAASIHSSIAKNIEVNLPPAMLSQIISNLVMNSLVHGFAGKSAGIIHICASIEGADHTTLRLDINDDGNGASADVLKRIFEPFYTTQLGQGGSGLGMHVVYTLVQRLGGQIELSSPAGSGLAISICLPHCISAGVSIKNSPATPV